MKAEELGKVFRCMYPGGQDLLIGGLPPAQACISDIIQYVPTTYTYHSQSEIILDMCFV